MKVKITKEKFPSNDDLFAQFPSELTYNRCSIIIDTRICETHIWINNKTKKFEKTRTYKEKVGKNLYKLNRNYLGSNIVEYQRYPKKDWKERIKKRK